MKALPFTSRTSQNIFFKTVFLFLSILFVFSCSKDSDDDLFEKTGQEEATQYNLTVKISPPGAGSVSPYEKSYDKGSIVHLMATPSEGYLFKEWTGDIRSATNLLTIPMNSHMDITAVFELQDTDGDGVADIEDECPDTVEGATVDEAGCPTESPVYLDKNGITVKCHDWAEVGDTGAIDGVIYTVVDEDMLRRMISDSDDVAKVCTTLVTDMNSLFTAVAFNQDIGSWDVSNVTDMSRMFWSPIGLGASALHPFNQDISMWDVSKVTNMWVMFAGSAFNQDISSWNVGNVSNMAAMFSNSEFNQPIGDWDVGNVTEMGSMFYGSVFNQDISTWDVSNVEGMSAMFTDAMAFNQDLSGWNVANVNNCSDFSENTPQWVLPKPNFTSCTL